ncbi:C-GCAxxG-C-C family (seleno)protein [Anaeromyxobacter paludicola]|uniref:Uncharacterized protein n=1 Tax=Anaeromyxobacter paludicola TaxID=2918171 RepID=A0ABM7XBF5_9BACT|nr:C-GCAxxG-C-C family (seleno)protein [Anaeromyxobacter paludicola]BDG09179.1 hypothetical protein AMPC_22920 [Anaeromyxobacter paludicola]
MNDRELVEALRERARLVYEGKAVPHRSCGIAIAETFGVPTRPYGALRRGGLTGEGRCGAVQAGLLVLGELLGDPEPAGPVTPALREAVAWYAAEVERRLDRGGAATLVCNDLTGRFPVFQSEPRHAFCTELVTVVAEVLAEALARAGRLPAPPAALT